MCRMKNLTLRVDDSILGKARQIASEHSTSVSALVRDYLDELVKTHSRQVSARKNLTRLCRLSGAEAGSKNWTREDLYDC